MNLLSSLDLTWINYQIQKVFIIHYRDNPEVKRSNSIVKQQKQLIEKRVQWQAKPKFVPAPPGKPCQEAGIKHHASSAKIDFSNGRLSIIWLKQCFSTPYIMLFLCLLCV